MLKSFACSFAKLARIPAISTGKSLVNNTWKPILFASQPTRNLCSVLTSNLGNPLLTPLSNHTTETTRTVTKFSWRKGKRKSVKAVLRRFYRLHWGGWIRTKCGRAKKLWKKSASRKRRLREHVFCNATQCTLLDKMAGVYWMRPKYYVDDPYEPYHSREEFVYTAKKPRPYFPPEEQ